MNTEDLLAHASLNLEQGKYQKALSLAISAHQLNTPPPVTSKLVAIELQCLQELDRPDDCHALAERVSYDGPLLGAGYELVIAAGSWALWKGKMELAERIMGNWYDYMCCESEVQDLWMDWMVEECMALYIRVLGRMGNVGVRKSVIMLEEDALLGKEAKERVGSVIGGLKKLSNYPAGDLESIGSEISNDSEKGEKICINDENVDVENKMIIEEEKLNTIQSVARKGGRELLGGKRSERRGMFQDVNIGKGSKVVSNVESSSSSTTEEEHSTDIDERSRGRSIDLKLGAAWQIVKKYSLPRYLQRATIILAALSMLYGVLSSRQRNKIHRALVALKISLVQTIRVAFGLEYGRWVF